MAVQEQTSVKDSMRRVLRNRNLRRIQFGYAGSLMGDWAYATAITVWAFHDGGAAAVGAFTAVRFVAMAVGSPLGSVIADKVDRRGFMMTTDVLRGLLVSVAAVSVMVDGPAMLVYVLGTLVSVIGAPFRAAQAGLIPKLVDRPDELTASNAVPANLENVAIFAGPSIGAGLLTVVDVPVVFWLNVATYAWSFLLVSGVRVPRTGREPAAEGPPHVEPTVEREKPGFLAEVSAGFTTVARERSLRVVALLAAAQGLVWGALTVFTVLMAVEMLGTGAAGVGYLDSIMGGATVLGGAVVLTRISKGRLARDMAVGVLGWALPLLALAAFPSPLTAFLALAVIGLMDPWVNLALETIPQRIAPEHVISRVYAAVECALIGAMALGAAVAPVLIHTVGFRPAMALVGGVVAAYALSTWPTMRALDTRLAEPAELPLLRAIALFAPLTPPTLESLARQLEPVAVPAGLPVVREGETSDRFYVIKSGTVEVTQEGRVVRTETAGDFFGEIGLLRDVPRTATVTAVSDVELVTLQRDDFLSAVTGMQESRLAADEVVSRRLAV